MKAVAATLLAVVTVLGAKELGYSIRPIEQSGVLFERLGKVNFYTKHWTILSKFEMPDLSEELGFADNCSSMVKQLCAEVEKTGVGTRCEVAIKEIGSWVAKIKRQDEELTHHTHTEQVRRGKRSFFDGVGSLANTLFGTMDHKDSEKIYAELESLNGKENRTFTLLEHQITVVKSTFDLFNTSRVQAAAEREELWKKMSAIVEAHQNQAGEITALQRRVELNEVLALMTLQLREISDMQQNYASILVSLSVGKLHPLIIHARELTDIMRNATRQLDLAEDFLDFQLLMQIAKVKAIQSQQNLLIRVDIPQPQRVAYDIYKVYTIPAAVDEEGYHIYDLGTEFVAANNHERQYVLLDESQYRECQQLTTLSEQPQFLCRQLAPVITAIGNSCVLNLFRSFNVNTNACTRKVLPKWSSLVHMVTRNHWLFVMAGHTKLEVNCHNLPTAIGELSDTGILTLEEHCHLQLGDLVIESEDDAKRNVTLWQPTHSELPSWDSVRVKAEVKKAQVNQEKRQIQLLAADNVNQAWRDQEAEIQDMQNAIKREERSRQEGPHQMYLAATSVTGLLSISSMVIVVGVAVHLRRWKKKQASTRTSRRSTLPVILKSSRNAQILKGEQRPEDRGPDNSIKLIVPTTATLPTTNLPTVVGKQLVQLE